ncbi:amino-acid N-acetyltransferase [Burkholderiales bacterium]|nr:amino-acid N-acetyltransferase [Burkholderiales bacterium]
MSAHDCKVRTADWARDDETLRRLRHAVFVVEQKVPEDLEWDGIDADCEHAIAEDGAGSPVGCARLLPDGHIGRMAVLREWRGRGVGGAILEHLVARARARGHAVARLNAQTHAIPFYEAHGFAVAGDEYDDAGIPHRAMERALR